MWSFVIVLISSLCILIPPTQSQGQCQNPQGRPGICINIKNCALLVYLLQTNSQNPEVANFLHSSLCGFEGRDPYVCCPTDINGGNTDGTENTGNNFDGEQGRGEITNTVYGPLYPPDCGFSNVSLRRVVGGSPASLGSWPWFTALGFRNPRDPNVPKWLCGGALISKRHVLTAAHCVRDDLYIVRIGDLDLNSDNDGAFPFEDFIERKAVHPGYNPTTNTNDVAVLKTTREVPFSSTLHPICLPVDDFNRNRNLENTYPFIAGFGSVYYRGPTSSRLLQTQVPVSQQQECARAYQNFKETVIDGRVLCAGFAQGGKDSCQGDSGGPLMSPNPRDTKFYYVVGIASYGFKCAEPGYPGVYTRVTAFLDFIRNQLV